MSTRHPAIHRRTGLRRVRRALDAVGVLLTAILVALVVDRIFFPSGSGPAGTGSGVAATQARSVPPFTSVDLAGDNNVSVTSLDGLRLQGNGNSSVTGINSRNLTVALPGNGNIEVAGGEALHVTQSVTGSGAIRAG